MKYYTKFLSTNKRCLTNRTIIRWRKLKKSNDNFEFLITTVTLSSGNLVKKKFQDNNNIHHRYFPLDVDFLIKKFVEMWRPNIVFFVDSEIWPNFIVEIKKKNIPLLLLNARITKKTFLRWSLISSFAKKYFRYLTFA